MGGKSKGDAAAKKAAADAERQRRAQENKMKAEKMLQDSNSQNEVTKVELGGTDTPDNALNELRRKKQGGTVSAQVGVI